MGSTIQRLNKDPLLKMEYLVEIEGMPDIGFMEMDDVGVEVGEATYREGNGPNYVYKQPTLQKVDNITFKRGMFTNDSLLQDWFKAEGAERRVVDIIRLIHSRAGDRRSHVYRLLECYPSALKLTGGDASSDSDNAIVEITLTFEDLDTLVE